MSVEAISWALAADVGSATRKLVLIGYANHAHKDGTHAFPSKATIAEYANCDQRTVIRHVNALVADGWLRLGDQAIVDHLRGDRRPVVYDLAMSDDTREAWKVGHNKPGDNVSPRETDEDPAPGDNLSPRHGVHGVTPETTRGDTAVSPEPSLNQETPLPPTDPPACPRHPNGPARNCRGCGTTLKQIQERRDREAADRRRAEHAEAMAAERAKRRTGPVNPDGPRRAREALQRAVAR